MDPQQPHDAPAAPPPASAPPELPPSIAQDMDLTQTKGTAGAVVSVTNQAASDAAGRPGVYTGTLLSGPQLPHDATGNAIMVYNQNNSEVLVSKELHLNAGLLLKLITLS